MKKNINLIAFLILSSVSTCLFTALIINTIQRQSEFNIDLIVFQIYNPFLPILLFVAPLLYALVYILYTGHWKASSTMASHGLELQEKSTQEIIEEEIQNKYQDKIEEIQTKILQKAEKETEMSKKVEKALWSFCSELSLSQGLIYGNVLNSDSPIFELQSSYAYIGDMERISKFEMGVGINGQVAKSGEPVYIKDVPSDYLKVVSGLGASNPTLLLIIPIKNENNEVVKVLEVSGFGSFNTKELQSIYQISQSVFSTYT